MSGTLFEGNVHEDGNKLMDKLLDARATNTTCWRVAFVRMRSVSARAPPA